MLIFAAKFLLDAKALPLVAEVSSEEVVVPVSAAAVDSLVAWLSTKKDASLGWLCAAGVELLVVLIFASVLPNVEAS